MKKNKKLLSGICVLIAIACSLGTKQVISFLNGGGDKLPAEVNGVRVGETSAEKNARFAQEEKEQQALRDAELIDAPEEGLSRVSFEDLEQPAPLIGKSEVILFRTQYIVSFNNETNCPNYVCWRLTKDRTKGGEKRSDTFVGDPSLNVNSRVETTDYIGSGYDRGHMCPAGDNKNDSRAMLESFFMSNICPQAHGLNDGDWRELEEICREWARDYGDLYICCGPIYDSATPRTIGKRKNVKIAVPDRFFKVVLAMGRAPKAIGFIYPNNDTSREMRSYAVSVDKVEDITGFDFYPQLPDDQEKKLEAQCNPSSWGI